MDSANNNNYKTTLNLFGTFDNPEVWSVVWENDLKMAAWKSLGILLRCYIVYDQKQRAAVQYNQSISFGLIVDM